MMANCIVPNCHCTSYAQTSHDKGKILAYRPDCGCGHKKILHRLPTSTDTMILKELIVADSIPCSSLIPMSLLPSMKHFSSYDLIPIPPDEIDSNKACQALCLCKGFCSDAAGILQQFTHSSLSDVHTSLPSVQCTRCTHTLLSHQETHPSHHLSLQRILTFKSSVNTEGMTLTSPRLINFLNKGKRVTIVALVQLGNSSSYYLVFNESCINLPTVKRIRRSERLATTSIEGEELSDESDLFTDQMIDFLKNSFIKNNTLSLDQELSSIEPTSLSSYWLTPPTDSSPSRLMVAIGTAQNQVIIYNNVSKSEDMCTTIGHQIIHTTNPVTVVQYCMKNNDSLFLSVSDCTGTIHCWKLQDGQYDEEERVSAVNDDACPGSSITDILWIRDKDYIITCDERGVVKLYEYSTHLVCHYKVLLCFASCTCLYWMNDIKCILVGSADNNIHILSMSSYNDQTSKDASILNYFPPVVADRLQYCAVMKGHQSFVSGITGYHGNILSIGLDGYTMLWSYADIKRIIERRRNKESEERRNMDSTRLVVGKKRRSDERQRHEMKGEIAELEPNFIYKLGTHEYLLHSPMSAWNVMERCVLVAYQSSNRELSFSLY